MLVSTLLSIKGASAAGSQSKTLDVSATVVKSCTVSATPIDFGQYDPLADGEQQAEGTITLRCAGGTTPMVALDNGQFSANVSKTKQTDGTTDIAPAKTDSGVAVTRAMQNAGTWLGYDPFTNSARSTVWNASNTISPGEIGNTQPVELNVYGSISAEQTQTAGTFKDRVVITVTYATPETSEARMSAKALRIGRLIATRPPRKASPPENAMSPSVSPCLRCNPTSHTPTSLL